MLPAALLPCLTVRRAVSQWYIKNIGCGRVCHVRRNSTCMSAKPDAPSKTNTDPSDLHIVLNISEEYDTDRALTL